MGEDSYWSAFLFKHEPDPDILHVTHKYFGKLSKSDAVIVELIINDYFVNEAPLRPFRAVFNRQDFFGENNDIRVLLEREGHFKGYSSFGWFAELRGRFDPYAKDTYAYTPHVTTRSHKEIDGEISEYVFVKNGKVIARWRAKPLVHRLSNAKEIRLKVIRDDKRDMDEIERRIKKAFREILYGPLLKILGKSENVLKHKNSETSKLEAALKSGKVTFSKGAFKGTFSAGVSKELRALGAQWDGGGTYRIHRSALPYSVQSAIDTSTASINKSLQKIDDMLRKNLPAKIAEKIKSKDIFEKSIWKVDNSIKKTLEHLTVSPTLTKDQRSKIAEEWQNNLDLYIKDFTESETLKLRKAIQDNAFAGNRQSSMVKSIQDSYGVSAKKAKFLARQETNLLTAKLKEVRYKAAGVNEYRWKCVHMPKDKTPEQHTPGYVRYSHALLENKVFSWDNPPITTAPNEPARRNNPGQDYNCRCYAQPIVNFSSE